MNSLNYYQKYSVILSKLDFLGKSRLELLGWQLMEEYNR